MSESVFAEKENYRAWEIRPLQSLAVSPEELFLHLIGWAVLAPNSHNSQPWKFIVDAPENTIRVCVDGEYILAASDKVCRQAQISIGCALENLLVAADAYGLGFEIEYAERMCAYPDSVAVIRFVVPDGLVSAIKPEPFEAMRQRRMNRGKYDPTRRLPEFLIREADSTCRELGLTLDVIQDTATRFVIADIQYSADKAVLMLNGFRKELANFLLPNDTVSFRGMPGNTFGLNDTMAIRIHEELQKTGSFDPDLAFGFAASGRDGIKSAPALFVISVPEDIPVWRIKSGRALEKVALCAQKLGLGAAVHAAMVEVEMFNKLLKLRLRRKERPSVIVRIGYAMEERPHAPRVGATKCAEVIR